jgi:hypothetical protein
VLIFAGACGNNKNEHPSEQSNSEYIQPIRNLTFELDSLTDAYTNSSRLYNRFYVHYNRNLPSFYFYSLAERKLDKIVTLSEKTRAIIGEISYAYYHQPDKIFWLAKSSSKIYVTNENSEILETHNFENGGSIILHNFAPFYFAHDKIFLPNFLTYDPKLLYQNDTPNAFFVYDLKQKNTEFLLYYPEKYRKSAFGSNYHLFSVTYDEAKNTAYFLFPADKDIYALDLQNKTVQKKECTEMSTNNEVTPLTNFDNRLSVQKHYAENVAFQGLVYDKYRKCFYRFKKCATEFSPDKSEEPNSPDYEVAVIDENFQVIRIHKLKLNDYHANFFITEEGFFISKKSEDEDLLSFDCFVF